MVSAYKTPTQHRTSYLQDCLFPIICAHPAKSSSEGVFLFPPLSNNVILLDPEVIPSWHLSCRSCGQRWWHHDWKGNHTFQLVFMERNIQCLKHYKNFILLSALPSSRAKLTHSILLINFFKCVIRKEAC